MTEHWAYAAARTLAGRTAGRMATLETGYGPSGRPHMGTVAEVLRTAMVARAYRHLTGGSPLRMVSITDDMDGLRRVPDTVDPACGMEDCIGMPLCEVPDPSGIGSYAASNAALLRGHLLHFGLRPIPPRESLERLLSADATQPDEVLCVMASDLYRGGHYDSALLRVAAVAPALAAIVLPELRHERRRTWCPFVPFHQGRAVSHTQEWRLDGEWLEWTDEEGHRQRACILGGGCKLQWRVDWCSRWAALGVDFEMHGKDLMDSVRLGTRMVPLLGGRAPQTLQYELFLDEAGAKMSKSVGNGVGMDAWERHAPPHVFWHFLLRDPRAARKVGHATLPLAVDAWLDALRQPDPELDLVHPEDEGNMPQVRSRLSFGTVVGIAALADAEEPETVWRLLENYDPSGMDRADTLMASLVSCATRRHVDEVRLNRAYTVPDEAERAALQDLVDTLRCCVPESTAEDIQFHVYEAGKRHGGKEGLREFFRLVYGTLLGEDHGPRLGTLAQAVGVDCLAAQLEARLSSTPTEAVQM